MYLISDNIDTLTGMRLAGVDGIVVHEREELRCAIENAMEDKDIGVILQYSTSARNYQIWKRISRIDRRDQAGADNAASDRDS